jgi:hypothetical protein
MFGVKTLKSTSLGRHRLEDNIKMYENELQCEAAEWIHLARDRDLVIILWVAHSAENFWNGFLSTQLRGFSLISGNG